MSLGGKTVYHLGDTGLFSDLALPGRRDDIDVALMCIAAIHDGSRGRRGRSRARGREAGDPECHYNTFPPIEQDAGRFKLTWSRARLRGGHLDPARRIRSKEATMASFTDRRWRRTLTSCCTRSVVRAGERRPAGRPAARLEVRARERGRAERPRRTCAGRASRGDEGFVVTCFDPDAPTGSGFLALDRRGAPRGRHRAAPGSRQRRPAGRRVPRPQRLQRQRLRRAGPAAGDRDHRYDFAVHAIDVPSYDGVGETASPAFVGFNTTFPCWRAGRSGRPTGWTRRGEVGQPAKPPLGSRPPVT